MKPDPTTAEDQILLRRFAKTRDEAAFRALVGKYTSLVFGVAMRRTRQRDAAEEIVQTVFLVLARKAGSLGGQRSLGAWLHRTATFESLKSLRQDSTRQRHLDMIREHQESDLGDGEAFWKDVRPVLDQQLDRLPASDREILVAHYFEGRQFAEIAGRIGLTAAAAQKRGARALKKLAGLLGKRGAVIPVTVLASGMSAELAHAVPAGLATNVGTGVLGSTITTTATGISASTTSFFATMTTSKLAFAATFLIAASLPVGVHYAESASAGPDQPVPDSLSHSTASDSNSSSDKNSKWVFDADNFRESLQRLNDAEEYDPDRVRQLQRRLLGLDLEEVREAIGVLDEFEIPDRLRDLMQMAFARWAELDPIAAVEEAGSRPTNPWGYYPIHGAWDTWAFSDWDSARVWARDTQTEYDHSFLYWHYLDTMGAIDGELTVARSLELGEDHPELRDKVLGRALSNWARWEPGPAIDWMRENLDDPVQRDVVVGTALEGMGEREPVKALDQVGLIGNIERQQEVRYDIYWMWALQQPRAAADYLEQSGGEGWGESTLRSAGEAIARNDPERAIEIATSISDLEGRDSFYVGILGGARESDYSLVIEAANQLSSEGGRTNGSLRYFLEDWADRDRRAARAWVDALPEGQKKKDAQHLFPRG